MTQPSTGFPTMTAGEFAQWSAERAEGEHYELLDGFVVEMMGESNEHNAAKSDVTRQFFEQLPLDGPCDVRLDGVSVKVSEDTVFEPDVVIHCGSMPEGETWIDDPTILVEIVSPSSARTDFSVKPARYLALESVQAVVVVDAQAERVTVFRRGGTVQFAGRNDSVALPLMDGASVTLDLTRVFDRAKRAVGR